jgi:hypothetical protein
MRKAVPLVAVVVLGILAVFVGLRLAGFRIIGPEVKITTLDPAMCDAHVSISLEKDSMGILQIVANPDPVCLAIGRPLTWEIKDQPEAVKAMITIKFKPQTAGTSPFLYDPQNNGDNTADGTYEHTGPGKVNSNNAIKNARWTYSVTWKMDGVDKPVVTSDPVVCIRD